MNEKNTPMKPKNNEEELPSLDSNIENKGNGSSSSVLDEEWLSLTQDWQAQPFEKTNIQALLRQTKRRTLWAKFLLALNVAFTLGLIVFLLVGLYRNSFETATIVYLGLASLLSPVFLYYEIKIRLNVWQQGCDSPDKAIVNAISGCESSIKYVQLSKKSTWLLLPIVDIYLFAMADNSGKSPWLYIASFNLFVLVMWFISHSIQKKREKELAQLLSLQGDEMEE